MHGVSRAVFECGTLCRMPIPAGIVRVTLRWTPQATDWPNEIAMNTFHLRVTSTVPPSGGWDTTLAEIAHTVHTTLVANWSTVHGVFASGYRIHEIGAAALDTNGDTTNEAVEAVPDSDLNGSGSSGVMPPEVAICLSLYNYQPGAFAQHRGQKRGRMYLPYISTTAADSAGKVISTHRDALLTGFSAFFGALVGTTTPSSTFEPGILSRAGGEFHTLNYLAVDDHFDSQRRRQHQAPAIVSTHTVVPVP